MVTFGDSEKAQSRAPPVTNSNQTSWVTLILDIKLAVIGKWKLTNIGGPTALKIC